MILYHTSEAYAIKSYCYVELRLQSQAHLGIIPIEISGSYF